MSFEWAYRNGEPPWDIGRAQPVLTRLAEQGAITGRVVDLGCGTGENGLYLASLGLDVTGVDAAPTAIARARDKAAERGLDATFVLSDALEFLATGQTFDSAIDSGFFHTLSDAERDRYQRGLRDALRPGGRCFMLCFSDRQPGTDGPRRVSQAEIRAAFSEGWRVDSIVEESFATRDQNSGPYAPRAWLASLTRLGDASRPTEAAAPEAAAPEAAAPDRSERNASRTALGAAGLRAAHIVLDDPPPILDDPLAVRLLDPEAARSIRDHADRFFTPASRAIRCEVVVRGRFAEDRLADAVRRGMRQYVILGAGLDTFAYRQPAWAGDLTVFEVDHPASQRDKRERLRSAGIEEPPNVRYVAADLEGDDLRQVLVEAGLDATRPAFVACLGVLIYLTDCAAGSIFATTGALASGSRFVFTFSRPDSSTAGPPVPGSAAARVAAMREPWQTRFEPESLTSRLKTAGFASVALLFADDITERYLLGRNDGLRAPSRAVLAEAVV